MDISCSTKAFLVRYRISQFYTRCYAAWIDHCKRPSGIKSKRISEESTEVLSRKPYTTNITTTTIIAITATVTATATATDTSTATATTAIAPTTN